MPSSLPFWFEATTIAVLLAVLAADLLLAYRRPRVPSSRESAAWITFYVLLALGFAGLMLLLGDSDQAAQFVSGWLTEYSLSVDNLFVFLLIMARFSVPRAVQQEVLMAGILLALLFRWVFIVLGAQLIEHFSWVFYLFGAFLLVTAVNQVRGGEQADQAREGRMLEWLRARIRITDEFDGGRLRTSVDGHRRFTPVLLVLVALGTTDLLFALDSIPAIFGITQSAFIVFTANVFALMGLRQLFFLLGTLVETLVYLRYGVAAILAFIGVKLVLHAMHENTLPFVNGGRGVAWAPEIPTLVSLVVIVAAMAVAVAASLLQLRLSRRRAARG